MKPNPTAILMLAAALLAGCANAPKPPQAAATTAQTPTAPANDFPTLTRVEYVLSCMQEKGGKNYDNLYHCVCAVDHIAAKLPHEEFLQAETFATNANLPGERGGVFRDPPQSKALRDTLKAAQDEAVAACFPNGGKTSAPRPK
jgi:outer membrane murein-binding lipoprotein Lpp